MGFFKERGEKEAWIRDSSGNAKGGTIREWGKGRRGEVGRRGGGKVVEIHFLARTNNGCEEPLYRGGGGKGKLPTPSRICTSRKARGVKGKVSNSEYCG